MCGIAGAVALKPASEVDVDRVNEMSRLVGHRGPDDDGLWRAPSGRALLAHRRLEVIDLATGQQPMANADNSVGLVFNGEIYNYKELREDMVGRGVEFRTASDTEVILRAFEERGAESVDSLRGMFAFAIWNDADATLTLVRDRLGKKPLFYCIDGGCLYFSSTLESLRKSSARPRTIQPLAIDAFLQLGYIPAPTTVCDGIFKLEAGTLATASPGSTEVQHREFWNPRHSDPFVGPYDRALDRLDELLHESVALRLRSDVPLGVFLSGGIDSSLVAAVAARQYGDGLQTFSIGFDVEAFDESPYARQVADKLGTDHHEFRAQPDLMALLPEIVRHFGEPYGDSSALPVWLLAQRAREHVTVAVGGDGGDESFAGYDWYRNALRIGKIADRIPQPALQLAQQGVAAIDARTESRNLARLNRALAALGAGSDASRYARLRSFFSDPEVEAVYDGDLRAATAGRYPARAFLEELFDASSGSLLRRMQYVDIRSYLADDLLPKVDVATMAHGLEARAPLLDHNIMEFALSLPPEFLVQGKKGKRILRDVLSRYLPPQLFDRPKQGFTLPLRSWFVASLRAHVEKLPTSSVLLDTGWFRSRASLVWSTSTSPARATTVSDCTFSWRSRNG